MSKILCVGALTLDTIFRLDTLPTKPGKFVPEDAVIVAEGMAAAQAATIARLGGDVALWANAGDDPTGDRLVSEIGAEGVDMSRIRRHPGRRSGFSTIFMDHAGERIIVPRYDPELMSDPGTPPDLDGIGVVMADVRWVTGAALALEAAAAKGIPGILDADAAHIDVLNRLVPLASHVVGSQQAAEQLTGSADPAEATRRLAANHPGFVAITAGERGCWWTDNGAVRHTPGFPVEAIDTLAAGDVFHGAFAFGLADVWEMERLIRFASAAAAIKCTRFGGRLGAPTRAEVEAFLQQA